MAKYQIKLPDGATYEIEAPDDMPEAQVREKFEASMAQAPPPEATTPPADDWRDTGVGGFVRGLRDIPDAGAELMTRAVEAAIPDDWGLDKWAKRQVAEIVRINREAEREYQEDWRGGQMRGKFDKSRLAGNIAATLPLAAIPGGAAASALARTGQAAAAGGLSGALMPVHGDKDDFWKTKAMQTGLGVAGGVTAPYLARGAARVVSPATDAATKRLVKAGVPMTPGQILGGAWKATEEKLTSIPFFGDAIKSAHLRGLVAFNKAVGDRVLNSIGQTVSKKISAGPDMVRHVGNELSRAYDDALKGVNVYMDDAFRGDISNLASMADEIGGAAGNRFKVILENKVFSKFKGDRPGMDGRSWKGVEEQLGILAKKFKKSADVDQNEIGHALTEAQAAWRDLLARHAGGKAQRVADINAGWAKLTILENAATAAKGRVFTAPQYMAAVKKADPRVRQRGIARGEALEVPMAQAAVEKLAQRVPESGTTPRALLAGGLMGGGYFEPTAAALTGLGLTAGAGAYTSPMQRLLQTFLTRRPQAAGIYGGGLRRAAPTLSPVAPQALGGLIGP
jgi:hypothetical protein